MNIKIGLEGHAGRYASMSNIYLKDKYKPKSLISDDEMSIDQCIINNQFIKMYLFYIF